MQEVLLNMRGGGDWYLQDTTEIISIERKSLTGEMFYQISHLLLLEKTCKVSPVLINR